MARNGEKRTSISGWMGSSEERETYLCLVQSHSNAITAKPVSCLMFLIKKFMNTELSVPMQAATRPTDCMRRRTRGSPRRVLIVTIDATTRTSTARSSRTVTATSATTLRRSITTTSNTHRTKRTDSEITGARRVCLYFRFGTFAKCR